MDDDGVRGLPVNFAEVQTQLPGSSAHQLAMRGNADGQRDGTLRTCCFCRFYRGFHRGSFACDDDLPGRVEVGGTDFAGCAVANADDVFIGQAENGSHRTRTGSNGFLHNFAAHVDELDGFGKAHRPCRTEGGVFAKRVAGHKGGVDAAFITQDIRAGDTGGKQRGLGDGGLVELTTRFVLANLPQVEFENVGGFLKATLHDGVSRRQFLEHAGALRALAGEN